MGRTPQADYRPLIAEAALRRMLAGDEITIASIAAELEISPSLVHFYAGSREDVVSTAWRMVLDMNVEEDRAAVGMAAAEGDWELVTDLVRTVFSRERDGLRRGHVRMVGESFTSEALAALVGEHTRATIKSWQQTIDDARAMGVIGGTLDAEAMAMMIIGLPLGIIALGIELTPEQRDHLAEAWSAMLESVLRPRSGSLGVEAAVDVDDLA